MRSIHITYCILIAIFTAQVSHGQIIDFKNSQLYKDKLAFNKDVMEQEGIAEVRCLVMEKKSGFPVQNNGISRTYSFDRSGTLTSREFSYYNRYGRIDSIKINYDYGNGMLISEKTSYGNTSLIYNYKYDTNEKLLEKSYIKEIAGFTKDSVEFYKQETLSKNRFAYYYGPDDKVYKKEFYNELNKVFMTVYFVYGPEGNLIREITRRTIGGTVSSTRYQYDELNRLIIQSIKSASGSKNISFKYDLKNNLTEETFRTSDETKANYIFYSSKDNAIRSRTFKDEKSGIIYIIKYEFRYHRDIETPFLIEGLDPLDTVATKSLR